MRDQTPGGFPYRQHPHEFCGSNTARQEVGDPGHCEACCSVGHVVAHPDYGCADVGCYSTHGEEPAGETKPRVPDPWSISIDPGRSTHLCIGQPGCYRVEWAQNASWAMFTKIDDELGHGQPVERQADSEAQR